MSPKKALRLFLICILLTPSMPAGLAVAVTPITASVVENAGDIYNKQVGPATLRLMDVSLDLLVAAGGSTADPEDIATLQGGAHDPNRVGFTLQNVELAMAGAVDPYFRAAAYLIFQIDAEGETVLELEEAYATTSNLPAGFELKGGSYFSEFGRHNPQHPHQWHFVDQPVIASRLLGGDGLRGSGARLSWQPALPWYVNLLGGVQNANGETAISFLSTDEEDGVAGYAHTGRETESWRDLLYNLRLLQSFELSDAWTLNVGGSGAFGPNASGPDNRTALAGVDVYLHWKPLDNKRGFPFVAWQTELLGRRYQAGDVAPLPTLRDGGLYTQLVWGFYQRWVAAARYDLADGNRSQGDPGRDRRHRLSASLSWYASEYSRLRTQYNYDDSQTLERAHSLWLQAEVSLGAHAGHVF